MSIAQSEFWSRLVQSGLADSGACKRYAATIAQDYDDSDAITAKALAGFLVRRDVLTKFQAARLIAEDDPALRIGSYVMTGDQPISPLSHWIPVQTPVNEASPDARHGFLLRVPLSGLDETLRGWLALHCEIASETIQSFELSGGAQAEGDDQTVEIFSPLPEGGSLLKVLQTKQSLSSRKTVRIGVDLANALEAFHTPTASGVTLAHGAIGADHVWVTPKGHAVLLRDPSSPARSPRGDLSASWIDRIESPALYAAPELADPAAMPTQASDIYSLGCLLYSVFVGRPAFEGEDDRELFAAHNEDLPRDLVEALEGGASGNPILRVLAYAMAKDPSARFDSAAAFADALTRAGEISESSRSPKAKPSTPPGRDRDLGSKASANLAVAESPASYSTTPNPAPVAPATPPATRERSEGTATPPVATPNQDSLPATEPKIHVQPVTPAAPAAAVKVETTSGQQVPAGDTPKPSMEARASEADAASSHVRRRRKRKKNRVPILAGIMVLPVLMLGLAIALRGRSPEKPPPPPRPKPGIVRNVPKVPDSRRDVNSDLVNGYEIVESDRLLWVPPYPADSAAPSLELLPPGPAAIVSVAIADLIGNRDADPLKNTFRSEFDGLIKHAEDRAGVGKEQIERCTVALFPGKDGWPNVALAITLTEDIDIATLTDKWQAFESRSGESVIYAGEDADGDAYYIGGGDKGRPPEGGRVKRFAVGPLKQIREVAESEGGSIPLVRSMQTLWKQTSEENDLVALVTPNFLFADGRQMLTSTVPEFRSPLQQWLIPNVAAMTLSVKISDQALYVEMRELPSGGATSATLLKSFRESIDGWFGWAEDFAVNSVQDPSWRKLALRLPSMLRFVGEQTRSTILGETVVASTYLPVDAGTQVALGTFLAMNTRPGEGAIAQAEPAKALTVDEMLDRPMSISFLQLSLQFAVDAVTDEFKQSLPEGSTMPKVRIVGGDLEKNGITQNQQIRGFEKNNVSLRTVLTDLVLGANPDKTATGPSDEKQALVWVVHPQGKSPEETEILVTTRDAAKDRYELPEEFKLPE